MLESVPTYNKEVGQREEVAEKSGNTDKANTNTNYDWKEYIFIFCNIENNKDKFYLFGGNI